MRPAGLTMMALAAVLVASLLLQSAGIAVAQGHGAAISMQGAQRDAKSLHDARNITEPQVLGVLAGEDAVEAEMARSALPRLTTQQARDFAQRMIADHSKDLDEVGKLAMNLSMAPRESDLTTKARSDMQQAQAQLANKTGIDADRFYLGYATKDHLEDASINMNVLQASVQDPALKRAVAGNLKTVTGHLRMAEDALTGIQAGRKTG